MLFGWMVDSACMVFEEQCGQMGNCLQYDLALFRWRFHAVSVFTAGVAAIMYGIAVFYSRNFKEKSLEVVVDGNLNDADQKDVNQTDAEEQKQFLSVM